MNKFVIRLDSYEIEAFCTKNHIAKLSLFGSALREDFHAGSDVDLLVEFESGHVPGFFGLTDMELELTNLLGRKVDLRTAEDLSPYFRQQVLNSAIVQYARS